MTNKTTKNTSESKLGTAPVPALCIVPETKKQTQPPTGTVRVKQRIRDKEKKKTKKWEIERT